MDSLIKLLEDNTGEQGSFSLNFNIHKRFYKTPEEYYLGNYETEDVFKEVDLTKNIYQLFWYKDTSVGVYNISRNSIEELTKVVQDIIKSDKAYLFH